MHEYSVVQSLLDVIEDNAVKNGAKTVKRVVVKIGALSGVEPHLLEMAFNTFKEKTMCENADFEMIIQPIVAKCQECGHTNIFEKNQIFFECEKCQGVELDVLDGEDMLLMSLELE